MQRRTLAYAMLIGSVGIVGAVYGHFADVSSGASASSVQAAVVSAPNPQRAAECDRLLEKAPAGAVRKYSTEGDIATVVVGRPFYAADFESKQLLDGTLRCVLTEGRPDSAGLSLVVYRDSYTNKEIAKWSKYTGFSVD